MLRERETSPVVTAQLVLRVMVHPSTAPDHLVLLRDGEMVAAGNSAEADEMEAAPECVIEGMEAGSMLTGLSLKLAMREGQDAMGVTAGKLSTSWTTGCAEAPSHSDGNSGES